MKSLQLRLLALVMAVILLLTGCSVELPGYMQLLLSSYIPTHFSDMEYTRPDVQEVLDMVDVCIADAQEDDFDTLVANVMECMVLYQEFITNYSLVQIRYSQDVTDIYWTEEYNFCMDNSSEISAAIDQMLYALADSPHREALEADEYFGEGYFDDYEGESIWDETFTAQMDREAELLTVYYDLSAKATEEGMAAYERELCQVLVDLVLLRQEMAAYTGFESFHDFAYEYYYYRDYTPQQERDYLAQVRQELVPLYRDTLIYGDVYATTYRVDEEETFEYVQTMAQSMDGIVWEAFQQMEKYGLYDISYGENKYDASFEVYLPMYSEPFVFLNPTQTNYDMLTFAHEFGHFCNDYASYGAGASIDVKEIFSQSMEYLSLFYAPSDEDLELLQMVGSLSVYVEQSFYADFEMRLYNMDPEELNVDSVFALFETVCQDYCLDLLGLGGSYLVRVPHFYIAPCYIFSYVVSNDAAMQIYQLELQEGGAGLQKLTDNLAPAETTFLAFLESAELESPFQDGRIREVAQTLRETLAD